MHFLVECFEFVHGHYAVHAVKGAMSYRPLGVALSEVIERRALNQVHSATLNERIKITHSLIQHR